MCQRKAHPTIFIRSRSATFCSPDWWAQVSCVKLADTRVFPGERFAGLTAVTESELAPCYAEGINVQFAWRPVCRQMAQDAIESGV